MRGIRFVGCEELVTALGGQGVKVGVIGGLPNYQSYGILIMFVQHF